MYEISEEKCRHLRKLMKRHETLLSVSEEIEMDYELVRHHIRGNCDHVNVSIEPIKGEKRRSDLTECECEDIRYLYFDDRYSENELAEKYNCSTATIHRHIRFRCGHELPPDQAWGWNPKNQDSDGQTWPEPSKTETETQVTTRNYPANFRTVAISKFNRQCLVTGVKEKSLLEIAHILPWSEYPKERFSPGNILVLNQLHHAAFDSGLFTIDSNQRIRVHPNFQPESKFLKELLLEKDGEKIKSPSEELISSEHLEIRNQSLDWWPPKKSESNK